MGSFWAVSVWPVGLVVMGTLGWGLGGGGGGPGGRTPQYGGHLIRGWFRLFNMFSVIPGRGRGRDD